MNGPQLKPGERLDDLQRDGLVIIQNPSAFCFGTDAVLLSSFANLRKNDRVCDLGTGSGILPILLHARCPSATFTAVELQPDIADMASRSVALNGLSSVIDVRCMDIADAPQQLGHGAFDAITCNPPYGKAGVLTPSLIEANPNDAQLIARHEIRITLEGCVHAAALLVRNGGRLNFIHQSDRMLELMVLMQQRHVQPKRVRLVHPTAQKPPNLVLVEGIKLGRPGLKWLPPLFVFDQSGQYSAEIDRIYHRA